MGVTDWRAVADRVRNLDRLYLEWDRAREVARRDGSRRAAIYARQVWDDYVALRDDPAWKDGSKRWV